MTVTELKEKLQEIENKGLGKLVVAYYDESTKEVTNCDVCLARRQRQHELVQKQTKMQVLQQTQSIIIIMVTNNG